MCSITAFIIFLCTTTTVTSLPVVSPTCVDMTTRKEIRTVSAVERARLLAEYKQERRTLGPRQIAIAITSTKLCEIVKRIDQALAPQKMPYWDAQWDLRLSRPSDSVIFSESFFPKARRRRAKEKLTRETAPRGLTYLFRRIGVNNTLTSAIRASRAAPLLVMLYQLGIWKEVEDNCSACSHHSTMALCDMTRQQCVSRIIRTASCAEYTFDPCYMSHCQEGICIPFQETAVGFAPKKKIAERAIPEITLSMRTTRTAVSSEVDAIETLLDLANEERSSVIRNSTVQSDNSTHTYDDTRTHRNSVLTKIAKATSISPFNHIDNPHFDRQLTTWVYAFDDFLPYPSVYFTVTVVEGSYRPQIPPQESLKNVAVFSRGENLPNGYTHIVEALPLDHGYLVRVPDPASVDVLLEFTLVVKKEHQQCKRLCLHRRRYVPCERSTVRLSKYPAYTDKVDYFKTPRQAINHLFKGTGYFRRRTQDAFLFEC